MVKAWGLGLLPSKSHIQNFLGTVNSCGASPSGLSQPKLHKAGAGDGAEAVDRGI